MSGGCQKELYVLDDIITFQWGLSERIICFGLYHNLSLGFVGGLLAGCQKELYVLDDIITFHMGLLVGCQKELYVLDYVITFHWGLSGGCWWVVRKNYIFWIM